MADGIDEARDAFAQELPQATRPRDQAGRFVQTSGKPEPIFQPRATEGDAFGDTSDGGADPRLLERERRIADGRSEEGDARTRVRKREDDDDNDDPGERKPPERVGAHDGEDEAGDDDGKAGADDDGKGEDEGADAGPKYKVDIDGQEHEVTLTEALRGYQREETFNSRMKQMSEVAKQIDQRGAEANQARDAYIELCKNQEQEFAALIPKEPDWDALYKENPQAAHQLENNYKAVYGTLNAIRQRRAAAQQEQANEHARRTAEYARSAFTDFCSRNKLNDQASVDKAIGYMRRTATETGFSEDEISTVYDPRMLTILHKAAKYDNMMRNKPLPVQPERNGALQPGSAPRVGNSQARLMGDAQKRLASSGRIDDAAAVMAQLIRR
jgi:hypothetical protein